MDDLKRLWQSKPLYLVLIIAALVRLIAVIFSEGYAMHDDHFLIIESSQSWVDGYDYNNWLPTSEGNEGPTGHSFFYIGLHYFLFYFLELIGITSADIKMLVVRFIHAAYSLLIPYFTYKITARFGTKQTAGIVALLTAILWPLPMFSVRNLVEMVCIPPVMAGIYLIIKKEVITYKTVILAGLIMGLAVGVRIQSVLFIGGVGLTLWISKEFWKGIAFGLFALVAIFFTQISDLFIWGIPFAEFGEYIQYNMNSDNIQSYFVEPWYKFILVVLGITVPPLSLYFLVGMFYHPFKKLNGKLTWDSGFKRELYVYIPMLVFFIFHCFYPNKQERFILPFLPLFLISGILGWNKMKVDFQIPSFILKVEKFSWWMFIVLNTIVMAVFITSSTKRPRVESMSYLSEQKDVNFFLIENSHSESSIMLPEFYLGKWDQSECVRPGYTEKTIEHIRTKHGWEGNPNYLLFLENDNIEERLLQFEEIVGAKYELVYTAEPSFLDVIFYTLNPRYNKNEAAKVYKRVD